MVHELILTKIAGRLNGHEGHVPPVIAGLHVEFRVEIDGLSENQAYFLRISGGCYALSDAIRYRFIHY